MKRKRISVCDSLPGCFNSDRLISALRHNSDSFMFQTNDGIELDCLICYDQSHFEFRELGKSQN
jgi:hypothetical protein